MDINLLFNEALLAQAVYAKGLAKGMADSELVVRLKAVGGVTQAQAEYFASKYLVIQQTKTGTRRLMEFLVAPLMHGASERVERYRNKS